jgi:hypothetical protein
MAKVGSICSILAGVLLVVSGAAFFLLAGHFDFSSIISIAQISVQLLPPQPF